MGRDFSKETNSKSELDKNRIFEKWLAHIINHPNDPCRITQVIAAVNKMASCVPSESVALRLLWWKGELHCSRQSTLSTLCSSIFFFLISSCSNCTMRHCLSLFVTMVESWVCTESAQLQVLPDLLLMKVYGVITSTWFYLPTGQFAESLQLFDQKL